MKKVQGKPGSKKPTASKHKGLEENKEIVVTFASKGPYTQKPSAKFSSIKTADPFAATTKKHKTTFGYVYSSGGIPCKIQHGGITNHLTWSNPPFRNFLKKYRIVL